MRTSEAKLSFEYSRRTFGIVPLVVQIMFRAWPTVQSSPPLGALTVIPPRILKLLSETSLAEESAASETRIFAVVEIASGTTQPKLPVLAVEATITVAVAKLSVEYSSLTLGTEPVFVQVIDWLVPTAQTSPPFGAVRTKPPLILKVASEALGVDGVITVAVAKLSFEYSSFTLAIVDPVVVQAIW